MPSGDDHQGHLRPDVVVAGAGLAGLVAADELARAGMDVAVIEPRLRVGGRLMTAAVDGTPHDLGATWHWSGQQELWSLAERLGLTRFPQFRDGRALLENGTGLPRPVDLPPADPLEWRFAGGAQSLCDSLAESLPPEALRLGTRLVAVEQLADGLELNVAGPAGSSSLDVAHLVVAIPPRLVVQDVSFTPDLDGYLLRCMRATPTWMATALKCVVTYETPFWRENGLAGTVLSNAGPLIEVHDACSPGGRPAALWGFVSPAHDHRDLSGEERADAVLTQLARLFGPLALDPTGYVERDWSGDPNTNDEVVWVDEADGPPLAYGNPVFGRPAMAGRLHWAGAETESVGGGHMEGAVRSGHRVAAAILVA